MIAIEIIYGAFFALALFSALMVVMSSHTVYSALHMVVTMFAIAGLFVMMNAQLAGAFQIIVYAGAIMVLFMFVIMLLNLGSQPLSRYTKKIKPVGAALAAAVIAQVLAMFAARAAEIKPTADSFEGIGLGEMAKSLITDYVYLFEITSVLLLVGVIGAIMLARKYHPAPGAVEEQENAR